MTPVPAVVGVVRTAPLPAAKEPALAWAALPAVGVVIAGCAVAAPPCVESCGAAALQAASVAQAALKNRRRFHVPGVDVCSQTGTGPRFPCVQSKVRMDL